MEGYFRCSYMSFCAKLGRNFVNIVNSENFNKKELKGKMK